MQHYRPNDAGNFAAHCVARSLSLSRDSQQVYNAQRRLAKGVIVRMQCRRNHIGILWEGGSDGSIRKCDGGFL